MNIGVPQEDIIIEDQATNSEENMLFSYALLQKSRLPHRRIIAVQKPIALRRFKLTFLKFWPDTEVVTQFAAPQSDFQNYTSGREDWALNVLVADLQRIQVYSEKNYYNHKDLFREKDWQHINETNGFSKHEDVPDEILESYQSLISAGYTQKMIQQYKEK